ncbi:MAG: amidohydrolase family protein, partial [Thermoguttaceae bacterium]|nr:amidohydrolase family protein [Thermoguttaceae bacterium]
LKGYQAVRDAALGRNAWSDEAAQALEAGNAMREQDEGRLQRLQELAEKQALTKTEIAEAVSLAAGLKSRYGDVGVEVDALTGKIKIASGAQAELNKRMLEAKRRETQAALDEARANAGDGVIEKKIAEEEVGWDEALIGKKRGQSWSDWAFKDWSWRDSTADAKVAIASGDKNYQAKVAAAKAKNAAEIEKLEAELAGFDAVLNAPEGAASAPGTLGGSSGEASGVAAVDGKIAEFLEASAERVEDADLSPFDRKRDEIRDRGEALKDEMRKALDPDGVVDWSNGDSIWNFLSSRPDGAAQLQAFNDRAAQIDAATNAELAGVDEEERKKANEDAAKAAQEAARQEKAALKSVADFEARRAEEGKTNAEKRIDAIRKETAEYKTQLQTLLDLEKAKPEMERCADLGFSGIKLLHQCRMDSPAMFPMIEACIKFDMHIMMHSAKCTDPVTNIIQPRLSNGVHMANIARRYPEASFLMAHIGGGGDWKWSIRAIKDTPNVMADIGGSNHD